MGLERLGLLKSTLLDYPGRVAAVVFTHGCNLRCPWCHNGSLVRGPVPEDFWDREEVLRFLAQRRAVLGGVVVTGGEPLYHQDLAALLGELRDLGYSVKLDTNGTYPDRLAALDPALVDFVAMDLKNRPSDYHKQGIPGMGPRILESVRCIQQTWEHRQFRLTWVPGLNTPDEIPEMAEVLGEGEGLSITGFRSGKTLNPEWTSRRSATPEEIESVAVAFRSHGIRATLQP